MENIIPTIDPKKTTSKITKTIRKQYSLGCSNKDTCMGQYYQEDDWDIKAYGDTLEELYQN